MKIVGLDAGSVSVKVAVLTNQGDILKTYYKRHRGHPQDVSLDIIKNAIAEIGNIDLISITGSTGKIIASCLGYKQVNEIVAYATSSKKLLPEVRTVIEMGGEDSKLIILDENWIKDFSMNSLCAAGTGSFLDQQAERLRLSIEEFGQIALSSGKPPRIAGRCSVFAKSDMIHLQQIATPLEDIVAGLCFAVARNFKGTIAKGREIIPPVSFQGGVAANPGMKRAFIEILELDNLVVPEHFACMGAIGAALKALEEKAHAPLDIAAFENFAKNAVFSYNSLEPLIQSGDDFYGRHIKKDNDASIPGKVTVQEKTPAYMGIDIGSISTNLAVIDENGHVLSKRYLMTAGRPIEAVLQGLEEIYDEVTDEIDIRGVGTTGSGRYMIADFVGADIVKNEITAQATAAAFINSAVDTIFEIGGQDSKYISLEDGVIVDFEMNKACAAGTGSFLEEQAEKLNIQIKSEFAESAFSSGAPCHLGERCTVFMENSLMANLQRGVEKKDLLAGLAYSIVENYINRVVGGKRIGDNIFFQGGVAFNKSVVAAFEKYLNQKITVPPHHDVTGAIGMALIARDFMLEHEISTSRFKGFDLCRKSYNTSSFECRGCPNVCEINRLKIEGEDNHLFYGGRCEKYDIKKKKNRIIPDLFSYREEALWKAHTDKASLSSNDICGLEVKAPANRSRATIGLPYIFFFHNYLPFWTTLLWELGFDVIVSPRTNRQIVNLGVESVLSESCFPVKVAHGHIKYLLTSVVDGILVPSFTNVAESSSGSSSGVPCPYTQTIPYLASVAFKDDHLIKPVIDLSRGKKSLIHELKKSLRRFGVKQGEMEEAYYSASLAQKEFESSIKAMGREILNTLEKKAIVILGRAYNSFDSGVNLQIPQKLSTLDTLSIPMDFLPIDEVDISDRWNHMYWKNGRSILQAARFIKNHPLLYPIFIGNFSCGPDSFILSFLSEELGEKPFLHIEIDEHSADAGAITRCEAFLDSIENRNIDGQKVHTVALSSNKANPSLKSRKIYIPRMSDHAFALSAAFQSSGIEAEVLPPTDEQAIQLGKKYVSGKECYPCAVTTGDMVKQVQDDYFDPDKSAFFMPSGTGPCRFGQYNVFQRIILDKFGLTHVPIYSPVQDSEFYSDLGVVSNQFASKSWEGILAIELLIKCLHETRPYEKEKGKTERIYEESLQQIYNALRSGNGNLDAVLPDILEKFRAIPRHHGSRPLIGIVGEIFVRSNVFSNESLVKKIEALGGEVWLSPVEEWIYYVNHTSLRKVLRKRDKSGIIRILLKTFFQKRVEHRFSKCFEGHLKTLHEPDTKSILRKASPYMHESFEGEAVLSIGKSIDLIERGASGIINAMPFGCMPGTIVTAIMQGVSKRYSMPCVSIPYDGTESTTTHLQLEAFMEQAKRTKTSKMH